MFGGKGTGRGQAHGRLEKRKGLEVELRAGGAHRKILAEGVGMIVFKSPWLLQQPKAFAAAEFWNSVFRKLAGRKLFGREEFPKRRIRFAGNLRLPSAAATAGNWSRIGQ